MAFPRRVKHTVLSRGVIRAGIYEDKALKTDKVVTRRRCVNEDLDIPRFDWVSGGNAENDKKTPLIYYNRHDQIEMSI